MSLLATMMQERRDRTMMDKNETRPSRYGGLRLAVKQTDSPNGLLTSQIRAASQTSIGREMKTPVINYDAGVTIGNSRSVTIADDENTSALYTFTFTTYTFGFTQVRTMFDNNEIGRQEDFDAKMNKNVIALGKVLDSAVISALGAAKTQVFTDDLGYTVTGNEIKAAKTDASRLLGDITIIMENNDHFGGIDVLGNGGLQSELNQLYKEGTYNSKNQSVEYADKQFYFSSRVGNDAGEFGNMYAVQDGSIGLLFQFEREVNANGGQGRVTSNHVWGKEFIEELQIPMGTYYYHSVGDYSGIGGAATADMDRVVKDHFGFAVSVCIVTPYNSDPSTIANPVVAATVLDPA